MGFLVLKEAAEAFKERPARNRYIRTWIITKSQDRSRAARLSPGLSITRPRALRDQLHTSTRGVTSSAICFTRIPRKFVLPSRAPVSLQNPTNGSQISENFATQLRSSSPRRMFSTLSTKPCLYIDHFGDVRGGRYVLIGKCQRFLVVCGTSTTKKNPVGIS